MDQDVPYDVMKNRLQRMQITAVMASCLYKEKFINKYVNVLVESKREKHSGCLTGYSDNYIKVIFEGPDRLMKTIVPVKIEEPNLIYTLGSLVKI